MENKYTVNIPVNLNELFDKLSDKDKQSFLSNRILGDFSYPVRKNFLKEVAETTLGNYGVISLIVMLFNNMDNDDKEDVLKQIVK